MPTTEYRRPTPESGNRRLLFSLGDVFSTPGARAACEEADVDGRTYLDRHATGDWGDLEEEDKATNEEALVTGARILSAYTLPSNDRLWIITEADRASTTLLTPLEY